MSTFLTDKIGIKFDVFLKNRFIYLSTKKRKNTKLKKYSFIEAEKLNELIS